MRKFIIFCFFFIIGINYVDASTCDNNDIIRLKEIAANVNYNATFVGDKEDAYDYQLYMVNFIGLNSEIYVSDSRYSFFVYNDVDVIKMKSGINNLEIFSKNCGDLRLRTISINLPKFNTYSLSDECSDVDVNEFELCDQWYQGKIDDDYFSDKLEKYIESKNDKKKDISVNKIYDWFINNVYLLVFFVFIIILVLVFFIKNKIKNNKLD